jgi:hypothetical protein
VKAPASASPWQPLTFGGVAAFAGSTLARLLVVQVIAAFIVSGANVWFLIQTCFPVVDATVAQLPEHAGVRQGRLEWPGPSPIVLGETPVIALAVNATDTRSPGTTSDLEILFVPEGVRLSSLFGHWTVPYLKGWRLDVSRKAAESWWAAWRRAVVVGLWLVGSVGLMFMSSGMAILTSVPVRFFGHLLRRSLTLRGSWQLAVAASYPAQLVWVAALVLYGSGRLSLPGLAVAWVFHLAILVGYLVCAPYHLPRVVQRKRGKANPFKPEAPSKKSSRRDRNPFASRRS